jgi:membrane protein implicated in regulation of membrane protease activity
MIRDRMVADHELIGKVGRVTGAIEPGKLGEVMIPIRGGSESYYAYSAGQDERIERGTRVVVLEHEAGRTVIVSPLA